MDPLAYQNRSVYPVPPMRYFAAYKFVWTSPNGLKNLLLAAVCMLIPFVGILVLIGYVRDVLLSRLETLDDDTIGYSDFDFDHFGEYLMRGLWPFLVSLVTSVVLIPLFVLLALIPILAASAMSSNGASLFIVIGFTAVMELCAAVLLSVLMVPLTLRAAILEEFSPSFSWPWIKDFSQKMWPELLLSSLFLAVTSFPLMIAGYAMCLIGIYPAMALMVIAQWHLQFQIYRIYLARGGERVPAKPVLARVQGFMPVPGPMPFAALVGGPMSPLGQPPPLPHRDLP